MLLRDSKDTYSLRKECHFIAYEKSQMEGYFALLSYGSYLAFIFFIGNWSWVGYGFRYGFLVFFAIAAVQFIRTLAQLPRWIKPGQKQWANLVAFGFLLVIFVPATIDALKANPICTFMR